MLASHLDPNVLNPTPNAIPTRDGFGQALVELGKTNDKVVVLTADLVDSTRAIQFAKSYPERFIECGIAEQNMMGVGAGLALAGYIPFVASYATFSPGRNWDQLRVSVCYSQSNVKIAGAHSGISVGPDGATHQALEDIAITRVLPGLIVVVPCDAEETRKATHAIANYTGPCYIRFAREKTPVITTAQTPFEIGKAYVAWEGSDVTIAACGPLLAEALKAAKTLFQENINVEVINFHTIKPFDVDALVASVKKTKCLVTVEEHQTTGGLFGACAEALAHTIPTPIEAIGMQDTFGESGTPDELLKKYGMTAEAIVEAVKRVRERKLS